MRPEFLVGCSPVGLLTWLGLRRGDGYPNLDALLKELRKALPDDESVLIRYIAIVVVLVGKVAWADGRLTPKEEETLRDLLAHIEGLSPSGVEAVCASLRGKLPEVSDDELALCYRELKSLCDAGERVEILRLLAKLAEADGETSVAEHHELEMIASELGISIADLATVEREAASAQRASHVMAKGRADPASRSSG